MKMIKLIDTETGYEEAVSPATVDELHRNIATLAQLSLFIMASQHGERKNSGVMVQCQILDGQKTNIFLNSKMFETQLVEEFSRLGESLESAGVDTSDMLLKLKEQFEKNYKG